MHLVDLRRWHFGEGQPKKFKLKMASHIPEDSMKLVNSFLSKHGGQKKMGIAPRGAASTAIGTWRAGIAKNTSAETPCACAT